MSVMDREMIDLCPAGVTEQTHSLYVQKYVFNVKIATTARTTARHVMCGLCMHRSGASVPNQLIAFVIPSSGEFYHGDREKACQQKRKKEKSLNFCLVGPRF